MIWSGQDLDEILGEPPDQRRMPEDPVRIEIDGTVKPVAVIKVPVEHEHFVLAKIPQGVAAQFLSPVHLHSLQSSLDFR